MSRINQPEPIAVPYMPAQVFAQFKNLTGNFEGMSWEDYMQDHKAVVSRMIEAGHVIEEWPVDTQTAIKYSEPYQQLVGREVKANNN